MLLQTRCRVRNWHKNELLPHSEGFIFIPGSAVLECNQPDEKNNDEFNLEIRYRKKRLLMRSIDFDFI